MVRAYNSMYLPGVVVEADDRREDSRSGGSRVASPDATLLDGRPITILRVTLAFVGFMRPGF